VDKNKTDSYIVTTQVDSTRSLFDINSFFSFPFGKEIIQIGTKP